MCVWCMTKGKEGETPQKSSMRLIKRMITNPFGAPRSKKWLAGCKDIPHSHPGNLRRRKQRPESELGSPVKNERINKPRTMGKKRHGESCFFSVTKRSFLRFSDVSLRDVQRVRIDVRLSTIAQQQVQLQRQHSLQRVIGAT